MKGQSATKTRAIRGIVASATVCLLVGLFPNDVRAVPPPPGGVGDGLVLWLDSSNPSGNGTLPADGGGVSNWVDLSGSGNDAQFVGTTQATWQSAPAGFNGRPSLLFSRTSNSSGSIYRSSSLDIRPTTTPDLTVIALYLPTALSSGSANGIWGSDNGNWDRFFLAYHAAFGQGDDDGLVGLGPVQEGQTIFGSGATGGSPHLMTVGYSGLVTNGVNSGAVDGSYVYFNCNLERQFTDSTDPIDAQSNFSVGWDGDSSVFAGYIAEVIVYNRVLTGDEVGAVNGYLAAKYGLQSACASFIQPETPAFEYDEQYVHTNPTVDALPDTGPESGSLALVATLFLALGCLVRFLNPGTRSSRTL
jgi:hypothetical protein